jgi:hypothetical protein
MTGRTAEQNILSLGRGMDQEVVIAGSSAVQLALPDFRAPQDTNLVVSHEAFARLREQPDWEQTPDEQLARDGIKISTDLGKSVSFTDLYSRSWKTDSGVQVAGLPDIYAYKHRRATPTDIEDMASIRDHLQNESRAPLAAKFIPHEITAARLCIAEEFRDSPEAEKAILLAANGLHTVYTIYGHPQIGQANPIIGSLEQPGFRVPATYHNGFGLLDDSKALQRHLANIGASAHDRLLALAIDPYTDAIYGNGRFSDNRDGYDELRAANLLRARALQLGFNDTDAERMHAVALATTFDETTRTQRGQHAVDSLARAVVAVDLHGLTEPNWMERSIDLAVEDCCSARYDKARTLGQVLVEHDERILSTTNALELVDYYADAKPAKAPNGPTVLEAFGERLLRNGTFQEVYEYPADWTLNKPRFRQRHASAIKVIANQLLQREITAVQAGQLASDHAATFLLS